MTGLERDVATEDGEGEPSTPSAVEAAGLRAGKRLRQIAVDLYGRKRVDAADWHADGWMRARNRYKLKVAREKERERGRSGTGRAR